jgi:hypothetical protein
MYFRQDEAPVLDTLDEIFILFFLKWRMRGHLSVSEGNMNRRKEPPRLQDMVYQKICKILREVGVKWTRRLHAAAVIGRSRWLQEIKSVERECVQVRHRLASLPLPIVSHHIFGDAAGQFKNIIESYHINSGRPIICRIWDRQVHQDICANMLKAVLLPCNSICNVGKADSEFMQELIIQLLFVIPNIKVLTMPSVQRLNYMQLFVEMIQILTHLAQFSFHVGCTNEIIIELSKYCPQLENISVQHSKRVDDGCVEHLLQLRNLISLNVASTSISTNGYKAILSSFPQIQDVSWFAQVDPVLRNLTECLPSVRRFVGNVSDALLLVQKCPNITQLLLFSLTEDISDLGELRNVAVLSIMRCSCTVIRFSDVIRGLGPTLTILIMGQVGYLNINDLINYCTVLKELTISYCHIIYPEIIDRILPHFQNLTRLILRQNKGEFNFSSILPLYVNLEVLHVVGMARMSDTVIRQIVTAGGFRNVTEFVVDYCGYMSMDTAWLLMENCPNLTKLGKIDSWPGVTEVQEITFLCFVRTNNLPLSVCR